MCWFIVIDIRYKCAYPIGVLANGHWIHWPRCIERFLIVNFFFYRFWTRFWFILCTKIPLLYAIACCSIGYGFSPFFFGFFNFFSFISYTKLDLWLCVFNAFKMHIFQMYRWNRMETRSISIKEKILYESVSKSVYQHCCFYKASWLSI